MTAIRQSFRPKHQILILKCYPKYQKSTVEVIPNSSELSYLLYYCSTRRTKLTKVGAYLDKKTAQDMRKGRLGNIQVTLQIVTALIEKCPKDLPLYVNTVLFILETVLRSHDINLIEESLPCFTALCSHYDTATLSANHEHTKQYDGVVQTYAYLASRSAPPSRTKKSSSIPESLRYRSAGLQAIKSFVSADAFAMDNDKHLRVFMPIILENIYSGKAYSLAVLLRRESLNDTLEKEQHAREHRQSISVPRTADSTEIDATMAGGTAADVDQRADEQVGVLAMQSLRQIFAADNRQQIRLATNATLGFAISRSLPSSQSNQGVGFQRSQPSWSTELFEMICTWTPVQDRFIILVTATESLIRSPILEEDLPNQMEMTRIIGWLLRSNVNFIGLSVMDVLIGLIQHILLLLQLGGSGSGINPHHQQGTGTPPGTGYHNRSAGDVTASVIMEVVANASGPRIQLLEQLQHCIGDLATHIYYSDQIGDMVTALLLRLKPSPNSAIPTTIAAIENPVGAANAIAGSVNMHEKGHTNGFFSFETARLVGLRAVSEILIVANSRRKSSDNAVGRNRVDVSIWEGTQWLLRDPNGQVRKAYVEALLTWLDLEVDRKNLNVAEDVASPAKNKKKDAETNGSQIAERALSNASQKSKIHLRDQSFFLQLLHLAIYENALFYAESEPDILLLHLLLTTVVQKLGVNSVRTGLPMIFRLQSDIQGIQSTRAKIAIGSLVHGYFWTLSETFDFESSSLGRDIHGEIARRHALGLWLASIRLPPTRLADIGMPANANFRAPMSQGSIRDQLQPLDARHAIVDAIADGYEQTIHSPPSSPLPSPGRSFSYPAIISSPTTAEHTLPQALKEQMLSHWTKEDCLSALSAHEAAKAASLGGNSRNSPRHYLSINTQQQDASRNGSYAHSSNHSLLNSGGAKHHRHSPQASPTPLSASSGRRSIVTVADLKRALDGTDTQQICLSGFGRKSFEGHPAADDNSSDSMVSVSHSLDNSGSESATTSPVGGAIGTAFGGAAAALAHSSNAAHTHFIIPTTTAAARTSLDTSRHANTRRSLDTSASAAKRLSAGSWTTSHSQYYTTGAKVDVVKLFSHVDAIAARGAVGGKQGGIGLPPY